MRKKKILFQTDYSLASTGFGRFAKTVLEYLYKTGKYDLVHYCVSTVENNPDLQRTPWKSVGCVPASEQEQREINQDPNMARLCSYGFHRLDKVIADEKPDIYIASQDIWGVDFAIEKKWYNKITSVIWTTLDSLPILPAAVQAAKKSPNFWVWADFATKAMNEMGLKNVKTIRGAVDCKPFHKLPKYKKQELRIKFKIPLDTYMVGFVFRNQPRKLVPNLLEGYAMWKKQNPQIKRPTGLLLHTNFSEGWDIMRLCEEYKIDKKEIYTTYICRNCAGYQVKPFQGLECHCPHCGAQKGQVNTHPTIGVTEAQLNEIYNLMDVYCHNITSGGQEIPIQEAKLAELVTLVNDYSCTEDMCVEGAGSIRLDWAEFREPGTQFIKASTYPSSIAKNLDKVFNMSETEVSELGKKARKFVLDNFSTEVIGKELEKFLDEAPLADWSKISLEEVPKNPNYPMPIIQDDKEWLKHMYLNILKFHKIEDDDEGLLYWMKGISQGMKRGDIEKTFRQIAFNENQKNTKVSLNDLLDKDDKKRLLVVMPESAGDIFMLTSTFESIKNRYPDYKFYIATKPEFKDVLNGNPYVDKWIPYHPIMDSLIALEGSRNVEGPFNIAYLPFVHTQRLLTYLHNAEDIIDFEIRK